jgi:hypothetical protein
MTNRRKFINHIKLVKPRRPKDTGYDLRLVNDADESAFRDVYEVLVDEKSIGLVVKFPKHSGRWHKEDVLHSLYEAEAVHRMKYDPKLVALKRYAPTLLFHEPETGVIIMPRYKQVKQSEIFEGFKRTFQCMVTDLLPEMKYAFDAAARNFGLTSRGHYVLLDAGLMGEIKK